MTAYPFKPVVVVNSAGTSGTVSIGNTVTITGTVTVADITIQNVTMDNTAGNAGTVSAGIWNSAANAGTVSAGIYNTVATAGTVSIVNPFSTTTSTAASLSSTVTTTVLASDTSRKYAAFCNDSDSTIYLALSGTAYNNSGIRLNANGGSYEINSLNLYTGVVSAFNSGATSKVLTYVNG